MEGVTSSSNGHLVVEPGLGILFAINNGMGIIGRLFGEKMSTDVLELLTSQHTEVDQLFERLANGDGDRRATLIELGDKLGAHAAVEESLFYPAVMARETNDLLHESVEEHLEIKRVLADLLTMKVDEDSFKAKLAVLKENVSHHAHKEEEAKLFPLVRKAMNADERAALGNEVLARFEELMKTHPARNIPNETKAPAPLPPVS
jgi:iron-sulfur cluster repair protein YtfE (RIC family)